MHLRHSDKPHAEPTVTLRIVMQDPHALTGKDEPVLTILAAKGESILEAAMEHGVNIEHACGGVTACSTCHIYVKQGMECLSEATEAEEDRVDEAPAVQRNSRLSCQCEIVGDGPIEVEVPAWNRNAVKETPH